MLARQVCRLVLLILFIAHHAPFYILLDLLKSPQGLRIHISLKIHIVSLHSVEFCLIELLVCCQLLQEYYCKFSLWMGEDSEYEDLVRY